MAQAARALLSRPVVSWRTRRCVASLPWPYCGLPLGRVAARTGRVASRVARTAGRIVACRVARTAGCIVAYRVALRLACLLSLLCACSACCVPQYSLLYCDSIFKKWVVSPFQLQQPFPFFFSNPPVASLPLLKCSNLDHYNSYNSKKF